MGSDRLLSPTAYMLYGQWSRHHIRRELPYRESRQFKVLSEAGPAAYSSLELRYLSNSHVYDFKTPGSDSLFALKMLASLADRNFSAGTLRLGADGDRLTDYRSMDAVFNGGMRLQTLELSLVDHELASLIKTVDFFRMPTVQKLMTLKLHLREPRKKAKAPRRWAVVSSPLWIAGIHLLPNCERFEVDYRGSHLRTIGLKLVHLCEKFERGEISELVGHFKFSPRRRIAFPFKDNNKTASEVKVDDYEWEVYRFRNAATGEWLTACVGDVVFMSSHSSVLHIVKGEAFLDDSFTD